MGSGPGGCALRNPPPIVRPCGPAGSHRGQHPALRFGDGGRGGTDWRAAPVAYRNTTPRAETVIAQPPTGTRVHMSPAIFALGGPTLDNEFNHVCPTFWRRLGVVAI